MTRSPITDATSRALEALGESIAAFSRPLEEGQGTRPSDEYQRRHDALKKAFQRVDASFRHG